MTCLWTFRVFLGVLKTKASRQIVAGTCLAQVKSSFRYHPITACLATIKHYSESPSKRSSSVGLQKPGVDIFAQSFGKPQSRSRCVSAAIVDMRFDSQFLLARLVSPFHGSYDRPGNRRHMMFALSLSRGRRGLQHRCSMHPN